MDIFTDFFSESVMFHHYSKETEQGPVVMIIPFALLFRLQVSKRKKYILIAIFLFPMVVIVFAGLRLSLLAKKYHPSSPYVDPIRLCFFSTLEISTGMF